MKNIHFKNYWYPLILIVALVIGIGSQLISMLFNWNLISVFHLSINVTILLIIMTAEIKTIKYAIKFWAFLNLLGGSLGLLSVLMFLLIGRYEDNVDTQTLLSHFYHLMLGIVLMVYLNRSLQQN